ncbi:MAG: YbaK/EbsC family protein [Sulfolobales archaeon]
MGCRNGVSEFIESYGISARVEKSNVEVSAVSEAVRAAESPPSEIVKTLIVGVGNDYAAVVLTGNRKVSLSKVAKVPKSKTLRLAGCDEVRRITGFKVSGMSSLSDYAEPSRAIFNRKVLEKNWVWCGDEGLSTLVYVSVQDLRRVLQPMVADVSKDWVA